jgi:hypothetical protein
VDSEGRRGIGSLKQYFLILERLAELVSSMRIE